MPQFVTATSNGKVGVMCRGRAPQRLRHCTRVCAAPNLVGRYTPYEANTWMLSLNASGAKILTDPWLVGKLSFGDAPWFFEGSKPGLATPLDLDALTADVDCIILSQSLPDHAHEPTLRALNNDIPVIAEPGAAELAKAAGFKNVTALDHNQQTKVKEGKLRLRASEGSLVGPPWSKRQNAWLIEELVPGGVRVYYEPHSSYTLPALQAVGTVDIAIVPTASVYAAGFPLVEGTEGLPALVKTLKPKTIIPLNNNTATSTGVLSSVLSDAGTCEPEEVKGRLAGLGCTGVNVIGPQRFGQPLNVEVAMDAVESIAA